MLNRCWTDLGSENVFQFFSGDDLTQHAGTCFKYICSGIFWKCSKVFSIFQRKLLKSSNVRISTFCFIVCLFGVICNCRNSFWYGQCCYFSLFKFHSKKEWMSGWVNGWMSGWVNGWVGCWTDELALTDLFSSIRKKNIKHPYAAPPDYK